MSPEDKKIAEKLSELIKRVRKLSQTVDELAKKKEQKNEAQE